MLASRQLLIGRHPLCANSIGVEALSYGPAASADGRTIVRLIGRIQSEYLAELKTQIEGPEPDLALDLEEVTLVDVGVVRFLLACEESRIELLHCSPYIRQWMVRERPGQR